jgi:signal transduction histidine kinase
LGNQPVDLLSGPGAASDYVEISVTDTGIGMEAAARATVFEPFFTTTPAGQGTGLGLSQLYGVVRQSNGIVRLVSKPGLGTMDAKQG